MSIKPYFQSKNTYNIKLNELEVLNKLDELKAPIKLDDLEVPTKLNKLKVLLPTLKAPQKPAKLAKLAVKCG